MKKASQIMLAFLAWCVEFADPIQKWVAVLALILGGYWTYMLFVSEDVHEKNVQMSLSFETMKYSDTSSLLIVHVSPKNIGKIAIDVPHDHFWLTLKHVPADHGAGYLDISKLPDTYTVKDIANVDGGYWLEPGVTYDETRAFIVPTGERFAVTAEVDYDDKTGDEMDVMNIVDVKE